MFENIKEINAIDYTDISKIPNFIEEVMEECYKIMDISFFGDRISLDNVIKRAMNAIAIEHFTEEESKVYTNDFLKRSKDIEEALKNTEEDIFIV